MKVVTISGSMRCALQPVYNKKRGETFEQIESIVNCHYKKIDLSDAIYVVNIDGYIGEATKAEIAYAKKNGKEIIYHEPLKPQTRKK